MKGIDFGTPAVAADRAVALEIDGIAVTVPAGTSLLRAAVSAGVMIPKLCATEALKPFGSCRLCLVEIEGRKGYPASCTTPAEAGMKVRTESPRLAELRRNVMELYVSDHPLDCLTCAANGNCELQTMAGVVGLREVRYGMAGANHFADATTDDSNPYFRFDPAKCIVCNRCVRACEEQQGSFALTIAGRGFDARVTAGRGESFMASECVSCGACVNVCPTATLIEKTVIGQGQAERGVVTTCAYCGVGCGFRAELKGDQVVRMVPWREGRANEGHACVKGRFAWGYATHPDRVTQPMIRAKTTDPWREVSWDEALTHAAAEFRRIQEKYGRDSVGALVSSRCTNEEDYLVQKLVRAAFGNNNVDTCARVCHAPTGYGLGQTLGTSAGTQAFKSIEAADVIVVIGANPSDGHPVFASRLKRRVREGARLIVIDPREIELVKAPHISATHHLKLRPGTNVAVLSALAHVIATEGLLDEAFIAERCDANAFADWREFVVRPANSPEAMEAGDRRASRRDARGGAALRHRRQRSDLLRSRRHRAFAGFDGRDRHRQPGHGHRQRRPRGRRRQSAARPEQRAGLLRHGQLPARAARLSPRLRHADARAVRARPGASSSRPSPGCAFPTCSKRRSTARSAASTARARIRRSPIPTRSTCRRRSRRWSAWWCRICSSTRRPSTLMSSCRVPHSWKRTAPSPTPSGASRACAASCRRWPGKSDWEVTMGLANALGYPMNYTHPAEIMDEIARLTPSFAGVSYDKLDRLGSLQWPCDADMPEGTPTMHVGGFVRGKGRFMVTQYVATDEKVTPRFPLLARPPAACCRNTTSAPRPGARTTCASTPRTCWRSTPTMRRSAASARATGSASGRGPATRCCGRG